MPPNETELTGEMVDLTPRFNYNREVEVVKRFIEKVYGLAAEYESKNGPLDAGDPVEAIFVWADKVEGEVRRAMGLVMSNDIERQIVIDKNFPMQRQFWFHEFVPYEPDQGNFSGRIPCSECDGQADSTLHLFA